jgi:hypothetical protein
MLKKIQPIIMLCIITLKALSAMSCVPEEIIDESIEKYYPPNKDGTIMLDDDIALIGNCTLNHNLKLTSNGKISIRQDAHLKITNEVVKLIKISGIKQDNLIFESQSSTIDIDAFTGFSCDEAIKHTVGTLHVYREASLTIYMNFFSWGIGICWYPFRESFKVCIDKESEGLVVDGFTLREGTFDHLEKHYGK